MPLDGTHLISLSKLRLTACTFAKETLSALIHELGASKIVVLGLCDLTSDRQASKIRHYRWTPHLLWSTLSTGFGHGVATVKAPQCGIQEG
jgi:hypothetical protein